MKLVSSLCLGVLVVMGQASGADAPQAARLRIALSEVEAKAVELSSSTRAVEAESVAAAKKARAQYSLLFPRLSLEATGRYVTEVPELSVAPGRAPLPFGDHTNYSVGPVLNFTLWDSGATYNSWKSAERLAQTRGQELEVSKRQVLLAARSTYFKVQLFLEQQRLIGDSLKLVLAQYRDIQARLGAGTASRIDSLSSHREVLNLVLQFRQNQADLASALRELFALTGLGHDVDASIPLDAGIAERPQSENLPAPTLVVSLDGEDRAIQALAKLPPPPDGAHPQAQVLENAAQASWRAAAAARSGHLPKVYLSAKSSYDYPNGPILERVQQNTVGVSATLSLFEWGRVSNEVGEKRAQAEAAEYRHAQVLTDLQRDWLKAQDQLAGYRSSQAVNAQAVRETEELAKLVYASYRAGRSNILEVQSANLRALEAKVQAARNEVQILIQLAMLNYLGSR